MVERLRGLDDRGTGKHLVVGDRLRLGDHHVDFTLKVLRDHAVAVGDLRELVTATVNPFVSNLSLLNR